MRVRKFVRTTGLVLLVTLAGVVGVQVPASASFTSSTQTFEMFPDTVNGQLVYTAFPPGWFVGDCTLLVGSYVQLNPGTGAVTYHAGGNTSHTNNGDIWHSSFTFQGSLPSGSPVSTTRIGPFDSPTMFVGRGYAWDRSATVSLPAGFHPVSVVWDSAC